MSHKPIMGCLFQFSEQLVSWHIGMSYCDTCIEKVNTRVHNLWPDHQGEQTTIIDE